MKTSLSKQTKTDNQLQVTPDERILLETFIDEGFCFTKDWNGLMLVIEKIHTSKHFTPYFIKNGDKRGVEIEIRPNYCNIHLPDTSGGYDYVNDCYQSDPLFSMVNANLKGGTIMCVYQSALQFIKWYNTQK